MKSEIAEIFARLDYLDQSIDKINERIKTHAVQMGKILVKINRES